jgi:FAD/FMN-containing dehydrogenase
MAPHSALREARSEEVPMYELQASAVDELRSGFRGEVLLPADRGYDRARTIWNGMFDRRPAIIARCVSTSDIIKAVNWGRELGLLISVKGGGHNSAGNAVCDDGLMIDLSLMRRVNVDPVAKTARIDGGALLGDVDYETQLHGLAVSSGIVSHTGVGGLTLGGGFGWISRKHGLSVDNLISAEVVTASGDLVTASESENPDLFWGIRGGGGNFGIATSLVSRCADIGTEVYSGVIAKRYEDAGAYLRFHRDYVSTLPDEMTAWMVVRHAPPLPFLPEEVHGKMVVLVPFVWLGDPEAGAKLVEPMRQATPSYGEFMGMNPWVAWQSSFDALAGPGARNYWKSHLLREMSDGCVDEIVEFGGKLPTEECEVFLPHMEGAPSRQPLDATAYAHRKAPFMLNLHTRWREAADDERSIAWATAFHAATQEYAQGVYVNFLGHEGEDRVKAAYPARTWERLVRIKNRYDPHNLFRMNQNIKPTG